MRSTTSTFAAAISGSHTVATRVEILTDGEVTQTIDKVIDGTVTLDGRAAVRGRCDLTIVDDGTLGLIPTAPTDPLAPYGNELRVSRGIRYPGTTEPELVSLGVFRIDRAGVDETAQGITVAVAGLDRAQRIIDARFEEPYEIAAATNYADAIEQVLQAAWPDIPTDFTATSRTAPKLVAEEGDDRWAFAQSMATSLGMLLYFDGEGTCVLRPATATSQTAVATIAEGEDGVLLSAGRTWNREGAFNRVIATGENTGETAPARGMATDDDPASPTYYYGPFGRVPRFYVSQFITTDDQAEDAAAAILATELGTTQEVNFGALVDPRLEPDDVIRVRREVTGIDENHLLDRLTVPLAATGSMTGGTRATAVT